MFPQAFRTPIAATDPCAVGTTIFPIQIYGVEHVTTLTIVYVISEQYIT